MLANSEDPDQTPSSAVFDLGLHCLPMSQKWNSRLMWINASFCRTKGTQLDFFVFVFITLFDTGV